MPRFRFGDRVRIGRLRGCVVLPVDGRLRAVSPDGRLHWLDHFVPDMGPDGKIDPQTWETCAECGHPSYQDVLCVNCGTTIARPAFHPHPHAPIQQIRRYETAIFRRLPAWAQAFLRARVQQPVGAGR